jgi:hypothetical protein
MRNYFKALWLALCGEIEIQDQKFKIPDKQYAAVPRAYVGKIRRLLSAAAEFEALQQAQRQAQVPGVKAMHDDAKNAIRKI